MKKMMALLLALTMLTLAGAYAEETVQSTCIGEHATIEVNGVSLYYEVAGEGKPVVLVHGNGGIIGLSLEIAHPGTVSMMAISGTNLNPEGADPGIIAFIAEMVKENPDPCSEMMLVEPQIDPASLAGVTCPVLVTAGSEDVILPEHTQLIADSLPNAILVTVKGHGHETYIQDSDIMPNMLLVYLKANGY